MQTKMERVLPSAEVEKFKMYDKAMGPAGLVGDLKPKVAAVDIVKNRVAHVRSSVATAGGMSSMGPIQAEIERI